MKPDKKCKKCLYYDPEYDGSAYRFSMCNQCENHSRFNLTFEEEVIYPTIFMFCGFWIIVGIGCLVASYLF